MILTCKHCSVEFELLVGERSRKYCSTKCRHAFNQKIRYDKHRAALDVIKVDRGCDECGYKGHPCALQWNHKDPTNKRFEIGGNILRKWSELEDEMNRCSLLCANCHAIHTHNENHYVINLRH